MRTLYIADTFDKSDRLNEYTYLYSLRPRRRSSAACTGHTWSRWPRVYSSTVHWRHHKNCCTIRLSRSNIPRILTSPFMHTLQVQVHAHVRYVHRRNATLTVFHARKKNALINAIYPVLTYLRYTNWIIIIMIIMIIIIIIIIITKWI